MKKLQPIGDEILTLLILILTLSFASSNLNRELLEERSVAEILPLIEAID